MVCLNPVVMKISGMYIGGPVVLNQSSIYSSWPEKSLAFGDVILPQFARTQKNSHVTIIPYTEPHISAAEVEISTRNHQEFMAKPEFLHFVKNYLMARFIRAGTEVRIKYLGHPCDVRVKRILGTDKNEVISDSSSWTENSEVLEQPLMNLSLSSSGDFADSGVLSQTPVKQIVSPPESPASFSVFRTPVKDSPQSRRPTIKLPPFFLVTDNSRLMVTEPADSDPAMSKRKSKSRITYDQIGGLEREKKILEQMVTVPLSNPEIFEESGECELWRIKYWQVSRRINLTVTHYK